MSNDKITIIGVGDDGIEGLTRAARETISTAHTVLGSADLISQCSVEGECIALSSDLDAICEQVGSQREGPVVLLTSGDPLFYGTAKFLCERLGKDRFDIFPHVSSMQLAFARIKESWDDAYLGNLASHPISYVAERIRTASKAGLFTTEQCPPQAVAASLLDRGIDYYTAYVCENIGSPNERVTRGSLQEIAATEFRDLNVLVLVRHPDAPDRPTRMAGRRLFGNPDECFLQSQPKRGLLTTSEVRTIALSEMDLGEGSVSWDVGAGSGSVAIEAAQLSPRGHVFAIEMDPEDYNLLVENAKQFGVANLQPVLGKAPEAWHDLPAPDAVFIGGTGRSVLSLVRDIWVALKEGGRLVINMASIDNVTKLRELLCELEAPPSVMMVNISKSQEQLDALRLESANPSFLVVATKPRKL